MQEAVDFCVKNDIIERACHSAINVPSAIVT